jgi:hypothetical protein
MVRGLQELILSDLKLDYETGQTLQVMEEILILIQMVLLQMVRDQMEHQLGHSIFLVKPVQMLLQLEVQMLSLQ